MGGLRRGPASRPSTASIPGLVSLMPTTAVPSRSFSSTFATRTLPLPREIALPSLSLSASIPLRSPWLRSFPSRFVAQAALEVREALGPALKVPRLPDAVADNKSLQNHDFIMCMTRRSICQHRSLDEIHRNRDK